MDYYSKYDMAVLLFTVLYLWNFLQNDSRTRKNTGRRFTNNL